MERGHKIEEDEVKQIYNEEDEEDEEEEALSLCDLPTKEDIIQENKEQIQENKSIQDEFDFCSFSKDSKMCSADQVFFQGQILPLQNSTSSEIGSSSSRNNGINTIKYLSRSESMDTYSSTGFTSIGSSRSSSIRSHQSSTSTTTTATRSSTSSYNKFNSHPSPKPQMKSSRIKNQNILHSNTKSRTWSLFRLGLVTTPEIILDDLKHRSINNNNNNNKNIFQKSKSFGDGERKKKKQGIFEANGTLFSTCKCSSNAIVTIPSKIGTIKKDEFPHEERKGTKQQEERKQSISRNRTFEWLKQLSLDATSNVRNDA